MNNDTYHNIAARMNQAATRHFQRGLSLIELMVAITISLLLLAGVLQIMLGSKQTYNVQDGMARLQENARYALDRISQDISQSGYLGCVNSAEQGIVDNNLTDQGTSYNFGSAIFGQDNTGVGTTDILIVRHGSSGGIPLLSGTDRIVRDMTVDSTNPNYGNLSIYDIMVVGDCAGVAVSMITNNPKTSGGLIKRDPSIVATSGPNIGQSNKPDVDARVIRPDPLSPPTVMKVTSTTYLIDASANGNGNSLYVNSNAAANEIVQGVEDFQVLYGVNDDTDLGADRYVTANNVTNGGRTWNDVVSARITLRLNTVDPVQAGATIAKTFTTTVRLRNRGDTT